MSRILASILVQQPKVNLDYQIPLASVDYISLGMVAVPDNSGRYRIILSSVTTQDGSRFDLAKTFADSVSFDDALLVVGVDKNNLETLSLTDDLVRSFVKALQDEYLLTDVAAVSLITSFNDFIAQDDQNAFHLSKLLQSGVGINDSFDLGDGLLYSVVKAIANVAFIDDTQQRSVSKVLIDELVAIDLTAQDFSKALADQFSQEDSVLLNPQKNFFDVSNFTDALVKQSTKALNHQVSTSDLASIDVARLLADAVSANDASSFQLSKSFEEFLGAEERLVLQSHKAFANVALLNDTTTNALALSKAEIISTSDAGLLVSQSYCDLTYFADNYVGTTRSF